MNKKVEMFKVGETYFIPFEDLGLNIDGSKLKDYESAIVTEVDMENKTITLNSVIHKVAQHENISMCGKNTFKDNQSTRWTEVTCPLCHKYRKPMGMKKYK